MCLADGSSVFVAARPSLWRPGPGPAEGIVTRDAARRAAPQGQVTFQVTSLPDDSEAAQGWPGPGVTSHGPDRHGDSSSQAVS